LSSNQPEGEKDNSRARKGGGDYEENDGCTTAEKEGREEEILNYHLQREKKSGGGGGVDGRESGREKNGGATDKEMNCRQSDTMDGSRRRHKGEDAGKNRGSRAKAFPRPGKTCHCNGTGASKVERERYRKALKEEEKQTEPDVIAFWSQKRENTRSESVGPRRTSPFQKWGENPNGSKAN